MVKGKIILVSITFMIKIATPAIVILDSILWPDIPLGIDSTINPNIFLVGSFLSNFVRLCTVAPNCESFTCDPVGFNTGINTHTLTVSKSTNYALTNTIGGPTDDRGYYFSQTGISNLVTPGIPFR